MAELTAKDGPRLEAEAKLNAERLDSCAFPHEFKPVGKSAFSLKYVCRTCEGEVRPREAMYYELGLAHAVRPR